jgi:glycosyltransferase involved in cell wall biosynthesis
MKFVCITFVPIVYKNGQKMAYGPYVKEMDLWLRHVSDIMFVCPKSTNADGQLLKAFESEKPFRHLEIPEWDITNWKSFIKAVPQIFFIAFQIFRGMWWANHIHLRCPGNTSLIACFVQMLFPRKSKTAKYAGNWDWSSKQPFSYRLQQRILRNTLFTHNMQALVYGTWPNETNNVVPFFTASYSETEKMDSPPRSLQGVLRFIYVGYLESNKRPLLAIEVVQQLIKNGVAAELNLFGNGSAKASLEKYVAENNVGEFVKFHGNQPPHKVQEYFRNSHFLLFISRSEGWPKVVAESMFWGCVPITTAVSCVPEMLGWGSRGSIVEANIDSVLHAIISWTGNSEKYAKASEEAMIWSRQFTIEKMESGISDFLTHRK